MATLFLALGLTPGADLKQNLNEFFYHEEIKILVTRSDVANLNQGKVVAYFPEAALLFHKQIKPEKNDVATTGAKLALSLDGKENLIDVTFQRTNSSPETYTWSIPVKGFLKSMRGEKIAISESLRLSDPSGYVAAAQTFSRTTVPKDSQSDYNVYSLLHATPTLVENKPGEAFKSVDHSYQVEFFTAANERKLLDRLRPGVDPKPGDKRDIDEKSAEMQSAWVSGRHSFHSHFMAFPLSFRMSYEGIGEAPAEIAHKNLAAVVHTTQNKGPAIIVIPALDAPDPKRDEEEPNTLKAVQKAEVTRAEWEAKKLKSLTVNADSFIREFIVSKLPDRLKKKGWTCLISDDESRQGESACTKTKDGISLSLTQTDDNTKGNTFWITDASGTHVYKAKFTLGTTEGFDLRGNYYPIVDGTGKLFK